MPELKWIKVEEELPPNGELVLVYWLKVLDGEPCNFGVAFRGLLDSPRRSGRPGPVPWWFAANCDPYELQELEEAPITHWARITPPGS